MLGGSVKEREVGEGREEAGGPRWVERSVVEKLTRKSRGNPKVWSNLLFAMATWRGREERRGQRNQESAVVCMTVNPIRST